MCELFGVSGSGKINVRPLLKEFFSHSTDHPNGWGMALFHESGVNLEKEPFPAYESRYIKERLKRPLEAVTMMAHIRLATIGNLGYENCHPFVMQDNKGRTWTLMHNGTIFDCPVLNRYIYEQEGRTDSERILCYIISVINELQIKAGRPLSRKERFSEIDRITRTVSVHNKVNMIIYDGELFYVHTNYKDSLFSKREKDSVIFSSVPLDGGEWRPVPMTCLQGYEKDELKYQGTVHGNEYIYDPDDYKYIYLDFSEL